MTNPKSSLPTDQQLTQAYRELTGETKTPLPTPKDTSSDKRKT